MAVHIEGITVVVRRSALASKGKDDAWFMAKLGNATFASDQSLLRGAFMSPRDVETFVTDLEAIGLIYEVNGEARDLAVVDQLHGFAVPTPWLSLIRLVIGKNGPILCARSVDESEVSVVFPRGWSYEESLYVDSHFVPLEDESRILSLSQDKGIDTVVDLSSGRLVHRASPVKPPDAKKPRPPLDLAVSQHEVFEREEKCIEHLRLEAVGGRLKMPTLVVPPKTWWRRNPTRHRTYQRPSEKSLSALAQLYGQLYHLDLMVHWVHVLYGVEAGRHYGQLAESMRAQVMRADENWLKANPDGPLPTRRPTSTEWLKVVDGELPPYDTFASGRV